jgi:hypothetical protein
VAEALSAYIIGDEHPKKIWKETFSRETCIREFCQFGSFKQHKKFPKDTKRVMKIT